MNLAEIEVFLVLATELHFGRTAERLNLSQPRITRMIQSLEAQLGGALFERTSRQVTLTPLGDQLRNNIRSPYHELHEGFIRTRKTARDRTGQLRLGVTVTSATVTVMSVIKAFQEKFPNSDVSLHEVNFFNLYGALRNDKIDILINWSVQGERDLVHGPIIEYRPRVLATAAHHPLAQKPTVSIEEVADYEVLHAPSSFSVAMLDVMIPKTTPLGKSLRRTHTVRTPSEILTLVTLGRIVHPTVTSVPWFQRDDIALVPIHDMPPVPLGLIWLKAHENQRIRTFAQFAEKYAAKSRSTIPADCGKERDPPRETKRTGLSTGQSRVP